MEDRETRASDWMKGNGSGETSEEGRTVQNVCLERVNNLHVNFVCSTSDRRSVLIYFDIYLH